MKVLMVRNNVGKIIMLLLFVLLLNGIASAEEVVVVDPVTAVVDAAKEEMQTNINIVWTCVAAFLVFFMQAGFAMVEAGFTRAKNAVNILMKNLMDFSVGSLAFFLVGFGLMFGVTNGFCGTTLFGLSGVEPGTDWDWTFLIFQTVFAATAATIVSGAMAERTKFVSYLIYSFFISLFIYPIFGSWAWGGLLNGGGWLEKMGFLDFAGSTVVHSVGGWLALAGAIILGPRVGKYGRDGKPKAIMGHNLPLAALGVFILWFGWFGFNPGSTTVGDGMIGYIAVTTNLAAAAGAGRCHDCCLGCDRQAGCFNGIKRCISRACCDYCSLRWGFTDGCHCYRCDSRYVGCFERFVYRSCPQSGRSGWCGQRAWCLRFVGHIIVRTV